MLCVCVCGLGVYVEVPHLNEDDCTITLRGPTDKLGIALTQVYAKVLVFFAFSTFQLTLLFHVLVLTSLPYPS